MMLCGWMYACESVKVIMFKKKTTTCAFFCITKCKVELKKKKKKKFSYHTTV